MSQDFLKAIGLRRGCGYQGWDGIYQVVVDFVSDDVDHFETCFALDAVDEHVTMNTDEVFTVQY
jgi:hypothetical protein